MKTLIAMSGGVDSSVAAYLMKESGADCVGATMLLHSVGVALDSSKSCCSSEEARLAEAVASRLGFEHHTYDLSGDFRRHVLERFVAVYRAGGTPNPCIDCNRYVKFASLLEKADELGCRRLATGHYARVERDGERFLLKRGLDRTKDQSYVLWGLSKAQLARTVLPLGSLTKANVRELARSQGFENADRPDSQDICFVPDGDYARFIDDFTGEPSREGDFVAEGRIVGRHKGITRYTLGQRKNLGVSIGHKIFVVGIEPATNTVRLGDESELFSRELTARELNLTALDRIDGSLRVEAKIRYAHREARATLWQTSETTARVEFDEPQRAITRGQSVVFYDGDVVIGGGIID